MPKIKPVRNASLRGGEPMAAPRPIETAKASMDILRASTAMVKGDIGE
jgi:hypothetical protein